MIPELFLASALALPRTVNYYASPSWTFGDEEVKVFRMLRDFQEPNPKGWVLVYGRHPLWVHILREAKFNVVGMYKEKLRWPGYIQGLPWQKFFDPSMFQIYLYDDFPKYPLLLAKEVSRVVAPKGFFLYRYTHNGHFSRVLDRLGWKRLDLAFHEFVILWRPHYFDWEIVGEKILLRSS